MYYDCSDSQSLPCLRGGSDSGSETLPTTVRPFFHFFAQATLIFVRNIEIKEKLYFGTVL